MDVEASLDTGAVYACGVDADRTATRPRASCTRGSPSSAPRLLVEHAADRARHAAGRRRTGEPTYAEKLTVDEFRLDPAATGVGAGTRRAGRQPAPGRVARRRRRAPQGVARPRDASRFVPDEVQPGSRDAGPARWDRRRHLRLDEVQAEGKRPHDGATPWHARVCTTHVRCAVDGS